MKANYSLTTKLLTKKDILEKTQEKITTFYETNVVKEGMMREIKPILEQVQEEIKILAKVPSKTLVSLKKAKANVKPLEYVLEKSKRFSKINISEDLISPKIMAYINYIFYLERYYDERRNEFDSITKQFKEEGLITIKQSIRHIFNIIGKENAYLKLCHIHSVIMLANFSSIIQDLQHQVSKRTELLEQKNNKIKENNLEIMRSFEHEKIIEDKLNYKNAKMIELETELGEISKKIFESIRPDESITKYGHELIIEVEENKEKIIKKSKENKRLNELYDSYQDKISSQRLQEDQTKENNDMLELREKIKNKKKEQEKEKRELRALEKELEKGDIKEYIKNIDEITILTNKAIKNLEYLKNVLPKRKVKSKELKIIKEDIWGHVINNLFSEEKNVRISTKYLSYIPVQ